MKRKGKNHVTFSRSAYDSPIRCTIPYTFVSKDGYIPMLRLRESILGTEDIFGESQMFDHTIISESLSAGRVRAFQIRNDERITSYRVFTGMLSAIVDLSTTHELLNRSLWMFPRTKEWSLQGCIPEIWTLGLVKISGIRKIRIKDNRTFEFDTEDMLMLVDKTKYLDTQYSKLRSAEERDDMYKLVGRFDEDCKKNGISVKMVESPEIEGFMKLKTAIPITSVSEQLELEKRIKEDFFSKLTEENSKKLFFRK